MIQIINGVLTEVEVDDAVVAQAQREERLQEIEAIKAQLAESDYKVVKLAEALAIGADMPYNALALHQERQALRDRINELEEGGSHEG